MNAFDLACAELSAAAYKEGIQLQNQVPPVSGATQLPDDLGYKKLTGANGFEASAFDYGGKIVIAYAGTNTEQLADLAADGILALGFTHPQLLAAAEFYQSISIDGVLHAS
jgi:hypothetical protein